jgi:mortality factor 4-like protein 1
VIKSRCRWDEWAPASRLLKLNEENVAVQKALQAQASAANASAASSSKHKSGGGHKDGSASKAGASMRKDGGRGTKRGREEVCSITLRSTQSFAWCRD